MKIDNKLAFNAISELLEACWDVFGTKTGENSPLFYYFTIIKRINDDKVDKVDVGIENCITGFKTFFEEHGSCLNDSKKMMESIPRDTAIFYGNSKKIYLEIQKYLFQSNRDNREVIRQHLLTISTIIDPSEKNLDVLDTVSKFDLDDGVEKDFMTDIIQKAKSAMTDIDTNDPAQAVMGLLSSGIINDVISGVQNMQNDESGLDIAKLMGSMQNAMSHMMPEGATTINDIIPRNVMNTVSEAVKQEQAKINEIGSLNEVD